jgi:hypothetical protein
MTLDNAGYASEVRKKTIITAIYRHTRYTFTTTNAVRTLMSGSKIPTTGTTNHFIQISRSMKLLPDDMGSLL